VTDRSEKTRARRRLFVFASFLGLIALILIVQLVRLTIVLPSQEGGATLVLPEVQRGSILDRQGRIMAVTTRLQRVSVWTPSVTNAEETARQLAGALGMDAASVLATLRNRDGYAVIKRRITPEESAALAKLKSDGKIPGVKIEDDFSRFYPQGRLASHVVGYLGADGVALDGIEYTYNNELAPQPVSTDTATVYGDQVFLTIDLDLQYITDTTAREAMQANKPDSLSILVMDARTGEILAYSALPDFDPNEFQKDTPQIDPETLKNRPVTMAYEPGSVFKIFSLSSLLDLGAITPQDQFNAPGVYEKKLSSGEVIRIRDLAPYGIITPQQIIEFSSNVGAAYASDKTNSESFYRMLSRFGFGKPTGIPLQGETPGLFKPVSQWSARSKPTIAMGQEVAVSAVQVLAAATAIANGGVLLKPQLVRKIVSPQGVVVKELGREPLWEVISPETARTMLGWMETATWPAGTAHRAAIDGVRISAKTGTAQVANPKTGTYSADDFVASMMGIFPTDDPRYVVYVAIQNPRGQSYYGSQIAAPIFRSVALGIIDKVGIPRAGTIPAAPRGDASMEAQPAAIGHIMPDLTGIPKKLLLPLLLRTDLNVTINGTGFVAHQNPAPGTKIDSGSTIVLELR
jgi:cell division protein FtsI (penicillin-binding protein 3)